MSRIAIVVLTDTEGDEALGRIVNALTAAREFKEGGDDVKVVFSGAGTKWVGELARPDHDLHAVYAELQDQITGACSFCAGAFGAAEAAQSAGVCLLEEYGSNVSYRGLIADGYQVLAF